MNKYLKILNNLNNNDSSHTKLLIIDGLNTFLRCFSAINHINTNGHHIGGLTGFLKSVAYPIRMLKPTKVVITFDGLGSNLNRKNIYSEYKSNRDNKKILNWDTFDNKKEEQESIENQLGRLIEYLQLLPIHLIMVEKLEADDIIHYLSKSQFDNFNEIFIMSADTDFFQLLNDKVKIYSPTKKIIYDSKKFQEEFNILSENYIIYKTLLGDKADNIPGVEKLGPKKLLKFYPELNQTKINLDHIDLVALTRINEHELFSRIHYFMHQLKINHQLIDLNDFNISDEDIESINFQLNTPVKYDKNGFLKMYNDDILGNSIPNVSYWLDNSFIFLNSFNK